jgi:hypothetical protein
MRKLLNISMMLVLLTLSQASRAEGLWPKNSRRPGGTEGVREMDDDRYPWIGSLSLLGYEICSVWIVRHGLAITAKHCIQGIFGMNDTSASDYFRPFFEVHFGPTDDRVHIKLNKIAFDSGDNDIAFLFYSSRYTENLIGLKAKVYLGEIKKNMPLITGGFPIVDGFPKPWRNRVVAHGCHATGFSSTAKNPRYHGIFQDTSCPTWDGDSGGVVFQVAADGSVFLFGVITDTFDLLSDGLTADPDFIRKDQFGSYNSTMFSPLSESKDLLNLLPAEAFSRSGVEQ